MAKKTRTELSTLAINTNLPDNTTELITPTTERAQLTDERESVVNYKDDLGGVSNAGKFITVATDGESLTMVDEPTGELSGSGVSLQVALWDGTKVLTGEAEFIYTAGRLELNKIEIKGVSPKLSINASTSGDPILDFQDSGNTKAELFYDTVFGDEKFVIRAYGVDTVFERAVGTPSLTITSGGAATFSGSVTVNKAISIPNSNVAPTGGGIYQGSSTIQIRSGTSGFTVNNNANTIVNFKVEDSGLATFSNGIKFGTGATLDAYEEGTWTPIVSSGYTSVTYVALQTQGNYTRIGNVVNAWFYIQFSGTATGSKVQISGLPFTVYTYTKGGSLNYIGITLSGPPMAYATSNYLDFYRLDTTATYANSVSNATSDYIIGMVTYGV